MYLRVTGLLSLIIILIIVVYYYLQSNRSKILEKYESYALRECKVYFTEGDTNIKNCDITQETSNYTGTCSYRFDGWNEFDTYTDNDGKTITYPKKVYTQTRTNTNDFNNPMFTNNCFKAYTDETCLSNTPNDNCIPPEFEYNANNVVRYDEPGTSGNTAVGTNIYGGLRYSSMQFLNTADARYNNTNLISSICDVAPNDALGSLKDKVFYMFEFNGTTNKLENIRSVTLDSNQTTFSPVSSDNVLTNLPPRPTDASFYGIQYDATNRNLPIKIFKKNNIPRNVAVFKFNYMSYICTNSQIKNYMRANRIIIPEKFIKYGSSTTPNYSKNISIGNMTINNDWRWSNYSSADFNVDYSDMLKTDLRTSRDAREDEIYNSPANITARANAKTAFLKAKQEYDDASYAQVNFSTNYKRFSSLIGLQKPNSITKLFNYKLGYRTTSINNFNISIPQGATATKVGSDLCIIFNNAAQASQLTIPTGGAICDIFMIGGGGGGGNNCGGGGGAGACIVAIGQTINAGNYTITIGAGGAGAIVNNANGTSGGDSSIGSLYVAKGGGGGAGGNNDAITGGCGGGACGGYGTTSTNRLPGSLNVVNGITNIAPSTTSTYVVLGTSGGNSQNLKGGGGGGSGANGANPTGAFPSTSAFAGTGGNGVFQVAINSTTYDLRSYFTNNGTFGVQDGSTGNYFIGGGGGAGGYNLGILVAGGKGGGGNGYDGNGVNGFAATANTGGGGGSGGGNYGDGGNGGSGLVIIRIKIKESINNNTLGALTDNTSSSDTDITTTTTLDKSKIKTNVLSSFIFLQRGKYKIRTSLASPDNILYSELIIYDNTTNNIIYSYGDNKQSYIIDINYGKFYKLAFRYIYCNLTNDNINLSSFKIQCDNQGLDLTNYLFGGVNINVDYRNSSIMNLLTNVRYEDNNDTSYNKIRVHLDTINFFNINALKDESKRTKDYMDTGLDAIIRATYATDASIINLNSFINRISSLKSNNNAVNYVSELPTTSPSIYKDITIDEIFGKNFDRLITKDKVKDYSALFNANLNTRAPPTKKIYVEAVAT